VIDDDPAMTELLKIQLQSEEVIVESAASGEEGLLLIKKSNPDIIILDLLMPELDGWQTCKKIRAIFQVTILILSAINNPALIATALDSGADDYLVKPVSTNILNAYLQKLSRRSRLNSDCYRHVSV
jgi:DNA-binding response OmpR family regulator